MKLRVVSHYLGLVIFGVGLLMVVPLGWSLYYQEPDTFAFLFSIGITVGAGLLLLLLSAGPREKLSTREALAFVTFAWLFASAFSALPYMLAGVLPGYLDALFEAVSGYTTTGSSVFTVVETLPHGILMWRAFTQWLGGITVVVLFVAIFPILGIGPAYLMESEQAGLPTERLTARITDTGKAIGWIYLGVSVLEALLLMLAGMSLFDATATAFSTISTGGYSVRNLSIAGYQNLAIEIIVIVFMVAGAINFRIYFSLIWQKKLSRFLHDVEFRIYMGILLVAILLVSLDLFLHLGYPAGTALRLGVFQAVSIGTTTGFSTTNFGLWPAFSQAALITLMLIGGSSGSTAGGLKISRIIVLVKYALRELRHVFSPRAVTPIKFGERTLTEWVMSRTLGVTILYVGTFVISFLLMSAMGMDMVSAASSVAATMGTVGPGLGSVVLDFAAVPAFGKGVLIADMLLGRLELWGMLVLLSPAFWKWR
ncbi:MAG: TrkH family potassium uptake protein [Chloroflexi bacterium]|nr:TrkH family potassium uptake protein [Chloroflexota bacterium]